VPRTGERRRRRRASADRNEALHRRSSWVFTIPGVLWLAILFLVPFYVVFAVAFGTVDPIFRQPVPIWNPLQWYPGTFTDVLSRIFGQNAYLGPPFVRTFVYVAAASALCLLIAYPVAYYVARYSGRRRGLLLLLLIAPFWISYIMRIYAWRSLLEDHGMVNQFLLFTHVVSAPVNWLVGNPVTVVLGLVYGYVPYMILPLFAGLDRIDTNLLEAARDLGASRARTFFRVTLPLSKPAILAGLVIATLPMFGDYFTQDLLAGGSPRTSMIGNVIDDAVGTSGQGGIGAVLVLLLMLILLIPMLYYIRTTNRSTRERIV